MRWDVTLEVELESGAQQSRTFSVQADSVADAIDAAETKAREDREVCAVWVESVK